jgi:hypothetical protein
MDFNQAKVSRGLRGAEPGRESERAAQWRQAGRTAAEVTRARVSLSVPDYPRTIHEGAPKQRSAARFREGRKPAQLLRPA